MEEAQTVENERCVNKNSRQFHLDFTGVQMETLINKLVLVKK